MVDNVNAVGFDSYKIGTLGGITTESSKRVERVAGEEQILWGEAPAMVQNGELIPNLGEVGSSYTHGRGHSMHTLNYFS